MNKIVFLPLIENIYKGVESLYDDAEYHSVSTYFPKTIFTITATTTNINATVEQSGASRLRILLNDSIKGGCFLSDALCDSFESMILINDDKVSLKLFTASKTIAIEENNKPTIALNVANKTLAAIPMILVFTII